MIPRTLSASSILVSEACMKRWEVENFHRAPRMSSAPADVGNSVHFALEKHVVAVYFDKTVLWDDVDHLRNMYQMGYMQTFRSGNFDTPEYKDGLQMVLNWHGNHPEGLENEVIACETKEFFELPTSAGPIKFNYIFDREDKMGENEYEVVDYKTLRAAIKDPEDLKRKPQPRVYALAMQIKYPEAKRIWVTFDMLRYDPVSVSFNREENKATWRWLRRAAERIIATEEGEAEETLNAECKWCIRKTECETLMRADEAGMALDLDMDEIAERRLRITHAMDGLKWAADELDKRLLKEAEVLDQLEFDTPRFDIEITSSSRRKVNSNAVSHIVGPEVSAKYASFTISNIDKLLKSGEIDEDQAKQVKAQITRSWSEPSAKIKPKLAE